MRAMSRSTAWLGRTLVAAMLLAVLTPLLTMIGLNALAAKPASAQEAAGVVNLELILDSSGSMAQDIGNGETRMEAAKRVMGDVIDAIPEREGVNVGFRIYGHEGNNEESGRAESCQSSDLTVPIEGVNKQALNQQVDAAQPVDWTPLGLSLERGGGDFTAPEEGEVNAMVMVTDGLETCDTDPCAIAEAVHGSEAAVTIHVVGFALNQTELQTVQCIADNGGGLLLGAGNANELSTALFTILEELQVVVQTSVGFFEIESFGNSIFPKCRITGTSGATDSNPQGESVSITLTTSNRVELNVGVYDVSWVNPSGQETRIRVNIEANRTTWIRGSLLKFPQGAGEVYQVKDQAGVVIWQDQFEQGDFVWVLPSIYTIDLLERVGDPIFISGQFQTLPGTATQIEVFTAGS